MYSSTLHQMIQNNKIKKIILGSGGDNYNGWISTDINNFNITEQVLWEKYFEPNTIDNLLAEHVFEHLNYEDIDKVLGLAYKYMKNNAVFRIAVPDANHPSLYVRELTKPGGLEPGAEDHKVFLNIDIVKNIIQKYNFYLNPIEYFDNSGYFHFLENDWSNGYISRSYKNYSGRFTPGGKYFNQNELNKFYQTISNDNIQQIKNLNITYTSLIFDLIKK